MIVVFIAIFIIIIIIIVIRSVTLTFDPISWGRSMIEQNYKLYNIFTNCVYIV